jgi:signal peptidase I
MLVTRYAGELSRGAIHWFHPPQDPRQFFVKRIIGLPGDRVRIGREAVYVNGQKLDEPYARYNPARHNPSAEGTETVVPENCYYVMGDNREDSLDSRNFGCVPAANFEGKPLVIYWSLDTGGRPLYEARNMSFSEKLAHTRWNRTFRPI